MEPYTLSLQALRKLLFGGFGLLKPWLSGPRKVVLAYHSVCPSRLFYNLTPTAVFEDHLAWLAFNCEVVGFDELALPYSGARPRVALTFDDGFLDNLEYAVPLLIKYGLKASFFVTTGLLQRDPVALGIFARSFQTASADFMDEAALRELVAAGMTVGAHSHTHRNLKSLTLPEQKEELTRSKHTLEHILQRPVDTLAYPFGVPDKAFDLRTCALAESLGYTLAGTVCWRGVKPLDMPLRIPRITVVDESVAQLEAMVYGALDTIGHLQDRRLERIRALESAALCMGDIATGIGPGMLVV
ncbi:polysaccharide deacetylase family protein [Meiothermus sp.]|jgi:peptidoglycan/xylan/chitin deacetylase (PgdA/CDA1 family)|uniref:polysaccharide deacetylase family protein n=1 Tax=Meiothermus sp. TaxID=1955249 RepID=UPI0021DDADEE|nr:polysaccharide deacetylase family protein [Meiothermus sp.]GIW23815.1 MAG: hypothetical protein KatS3mg069_0082 [Meiothermus sp.]